MTDRAALRVQQQLGFGADPAVLDADLDTAARRLGRADAGRRRPLPAQVELVGGSERPVEMAVFEGQRGVAQFLAAETRGAGVGRQVHFQLRDHRARQIELQPFPARPLRERQRQIKAYLIIARLFDLDLEAVLIGGDQRRPAVGLLLGAEGLGLAARQGENGVGPLGVEPELGGEKDEAALDAPIEQSALGGRDGFHLGLEAGDLVEQFLVLGVGEYDLLGVGGRIGRRQGGVRRGFRVFGLLAGGRHERRVGRDRPRQQQGAEQPSVPPA